MTGESTEAQRKSSVESCLVSWWAKACNLKASANRWDLKYDLSQSQGHGFIEHGGFWLAP